tara:strand:- start:351 stop:620 length:270 start_codon:yes stop_codon:yes gene_type:complete
LKNNPLVSILITNYNGEKFIKRCLNSCVNQTFKNNEIIFFDDASKDNSIYQVSKFKKIILIKNKKKSTITDHLIKFTVWKKPLRLAKEK